MGKGCVKFAEFHNTACGGLTALFTCHICSRYQSGILRSDFVSLAVRARKKRGNSPLLHYSRLRIHAGAEFCRDNRVRRLACGRRLSLRCRCVCLNCSDSRGDIAARISLFCSRAFPNQRGIFARPGCNRSRSRRIRQNGRDAGNRAPIRAIVFCLCFRGR